MRSITICAAIDPNASAGWSTTVMNGASMLLLAVALDQYGRRRNSLTRAGV